MLQRIVDALWAMGNEPSLQDARDILEHRLSKEVQTILNKNPEESWMDWVEEVLDNGGR